MPKDEDRLTDEVYPSVLQRTMETPKINANSYPVKNNNANIAKCVCDPPTASILFAGF